MKTKKIIIAGPLIREVVYTRANSREDPRIRAAKRRTSTEAQQRINAKYSWEKAEMMIAANFGPGDLFATLTFDDKHLPPDRKTAAARLKKFRKDFTDLRKAKGTETRMLWSIENVHNEGRWHVHVIVNASGNDFADLLRCWPYGSDVEIRKIQVDREKNYETLARYICKEQRERPGLRSWSYTRNCKHPETETFLVPDDVDVSPPEDATVFADEMKRTEFAEFHYIKYLVISLKDLKRTRPRARRRR